MQAAAAVQAYEVQIGGRFDSGFKEIYGAFGGVVWERYDAAATVHCFDVLGCVPYVYMICVIYVCHVESSFGGAL